MNRVWHNLTHSTIMKKTILGVLVSLGFLFSSLMGQSILDVDFSSDTTGQPPSGATISGTSGTDRRIVVVDGGSNPADPFGGVGNKSLLLEQKVGGGAVTARWNLPGGSLTSGVFEFSAFSYQNVGEGWGSPQGILYFYDAGYSSPSASGIALSLSWNQNGQVGVRGRVNESDTTDGNFQFAGKWNINEVNDVRLELSHEHSPELSSFRIWLNGELLTYGEDNQEYLYLRAGTSKIDNIRFAHSNSTGVNSRIFINGFTVSQIPEPGAVSALFGGIGVGVMLVARWRRRVV